MLPLEGRRVLVTGASSGIGRATAQMASERGATLALVGRNRAELASTLDSLSGSGHIAEVFDLDDHAGIPELVSGLARQLGGIDVLVNTAGIHSIAPIRRIDPADVSASLSTNVTAAVVLASAFASRTIEKNRGAVIFLSSAVGLVGQAGVSVYSASKGALIALTKSLALELARDGVRVNCVCPGIVETELTSRIASQIGKEALDSIRHEHPLGFGTAEDVASAVLYLASDEARWITGAALVVDGGYTAH